MLYALLDLFFPPRCIHCLAYIGQWQIAKREAQIVLRSALCENCRGKITVEKTFFCGECRGRIPPGAPRALCHPYAAYVLGAALRYAEPIPRELVLALKFQNVRPAGAELGRLLCDYFATTRYTLHAKPSVIIPIPLGRWRQRRRGYNQAELIAREVAARFNLPLRTDILRRVKNTKPQSEQRDIAFRLENVAGCFMADGEKLRGIETVFLVDDVVTSGATLSAAALALKLAADVRVIALAAAHA